MNKPLHTALLALCNRQRLVLALGFVLVLAIVLFNGLAAYVDVSGWSSGFTHPLHGGDHFITMLAVGIWAAQLRGLAIWLLPLTFVGVMSLGGLAGAAGIFIPSAELIILLSCLVFSVLITRKIRFSSQTNVAIVAFFAFFHGFAHGQEISTSASLISYTLGFMVATLLLHSAGILIVKLCVIIFALFISHLAYAQSSLNGSSLKSAVLAQTDKSYELVITAYAVPPDDSAYYRQRIHSGEDGTSNAVALVQNKSDGVQKPIFRLPLMRVLQVVCNIDNQLFASDLLPNYQLGTHFLTNGVGLTSPPVALIFDSTPRFCATTVFYHLADNGNQVSETAPRFDLANTVYTLATSFLTNGLGATSPPELSAFVVSSPDFNELAICNSTRFKPSIALPRNVYSSNSLPKCAQIHLQHRLSIAQIFPIDRQRWSLLFTNYPNIT
jgi:hydrogenase/urease accessory protein HupE